jgi:hypothetical protein
MGREKYFPNNRIIRLWLTRNLEIIRKRTQPGENSQHFADRAREYGISEEALEALRRDGKLRAIEIGSDVPGSIWDPKYHLEMRISNKTVIVGVYYFDEYGLHGVTIYPEGNPPHNLAV